MTKDAQAILDALVAAENPERADEMRAYHKIDRRYLGLRNPQINDIVKPFRNHEAICETMRALWATNIYEGRVAAGKLLEISKPADVRQEFETALALSIDFDSWAIADHMSMAAAKRLMRDVGLVETLKTLTTCENFWQRRAALVIALPLARIKSPNADEKEARETVLGWAASYVNDPEWFIQKAIGWWLRDLSKRDPKRVEHFLDAHAQDMKPFAVREARKYL